MRLYDFLINPLRSIKNSPATGAYMFGRILSPREQRIYIYIFVRIYIRWPRTCSDMFELENEIFVNGLASRRENVSMWMEMFRVCRMEITGEWMRMNVECDSVLVRSSRLVRASFRSITYLCESGFYVFIFCSRRYVTRAGKFE